MIEERLGDLFGQFDLTHVVHQANLYHTFGAGIAKAIRARHPYAYEADLRSSYGDRRKLGTFTEGYDPRGHGPVVVNLYSQVGIGPKDRRTSYDAMATGMAALERQLPSWAKLGIPHGIGCGLAGGDWLVVRAIIEGVFGQSKVPVVLCRLPGQ